MTKDEAAKIVAKGVAGNPPVNFHAAGFVACLEALGVLKFDPPVTPEWGRIAALTGDLNKRLGKIPFDPEYLQYALEDCGLKLVDK